MTQQRLVCLRTDDQLNTTLTSHPVTISASAIPPPARCSNVSRAVSVSVCRCHRLRLVLHFSTDLCIGLDQYIASAMFQRIAQTTLPRLTPSGLLSKLHTLMQARRSSLTTCREASVSSMGLQIGMTDVLKLPATVVV